MQFDENKTLVIVTGILGVSAIGAFVAILLLHAGDKTVAFAGLSALACLLIPNLVLLRRGTVASHVIDMMRQEKKVLTEHIESLEKALEHEKRLRRFLERPSKDGSGGVYPPSVKP
jgi:hypothetical protein